MSLILHSSTEIFPLARTFTIARGSRTHAVVVTVTVEGEGVRGRGECVPYARYGETPESVLAALEQVRSCLEAGAGRDELQHRLPPGAARNALDCALWDWEAKRAGVPAHLLAGIDRLSPVTTAYTISLDSPDAMAQAAAKAAHRPLLKIKLGQPEHDAERIAQVRNAAPDSTLIVDANEGWRPEDLSSQFHACAKAGVALIEQPLPAGQDAVLAQVERSIPLCADESVHDRNSLSALKGLYEAINIKLDKTGGLTEALALAEAATAQGFALMIGCMVGSSLAMAPAFLLTPKASFVDLDGPLLLAQDREEGLQFEGSRVHPPSSALWG